MLNETLFTAVTASVLVSCAPLSAENGSWSANLNSNCGGAASQATSQARAALNTHLSAVQSRDLDAFAQTLAEDVVVVLPNGAAIEGKSAVVAFHEGWFADPDWIWSPVLIGCEIDENIAVFRLRYTYRQNAEIDASNSHLTLIMRNYEERWLLVFDQNTRIAD